MAAFAFTAAAVGLLAYDKGGYYYGAWPGGYLGVWRTAIALSGLAAIAVLAGTRGQLRVSRSAVYVKVEMTRSARSVVSSGSRAGVGAQMYATRVSRPNA